MISNDKHFGDNFLLRDVKKALFEGCVRTATFISDGYLHENVRGTIFGTNGEFMHVAIVHWYPTLLGAAGITSSYSKSSRLHDSKGTRLQNGKNVIILFH